MFRYVAFSWNHHHLKQHEEAIAMCALLQQVQPAWTCCFSVPGLAVYCPNEQPVEAGEVIRLPDQMGVLLGVAFSRDQALDSETGRREAHLVSRLNPDELLSTRGKLAVEKLWGSYILFLNARDFRSHHVLRSPAALLACFYSKVHDVQIFFSVVDDYVMLSRVQPSVNWAVVRAQATQGDYLTAETALNGIVSIEGGECVSHTERGLSRAFYWNPCKLSRIQGIERFDDAVGALREETLRAVHCWASRYDRILMQLSGGLDSSIVLASLASSPSRPQVRCVNFYSTESAGDERRFARSMTAKLSLPLIEVERETCCDLSLFERCARTARPVLNLTAPSKVRPIVELCKRHGCAVIMDGELGDNVFGYPARAEPVTDYLQRYGPAAGLLTVARDTARLKRLSVWTALKEGISHARNSSWAINRLAFARAVSGIRLETVRFVTQDVLDEYLRESDRFVHPWFQEGGFATPGSVRLVHAIITTTSTALHQPFSITGLPFSVRPLVSQPLIEVALRIPANLAIRFGWNRAAARTAFRSELSDEVQSRTCKVDTAPWLAKTIRTNASWLREFLLDGVLAREGILDRERVESVLSERVTRLDALVMNLFIHVYIEGWLRQWVR